MRTTTTKNTLTATKVRKGHGPTDKKLCPELEAKEGGHVKAGQQSRCGAGPKQRWGSRKMVSGNVLHRVAAPATGGTVSQGSEWELVTG